MRAGYHKIGIGAGIIVLLQRLALPIASLVALYASLQIFGVQFAGEDRQHYIALGLIATLLSYIFSQPQPSELSGSIVSGWTAAERLTIAWVGVVTVLLLFGYAAKVSAVYSRRVLLTWFAMTPALSLAMWMLLRAWLRHVFLTSGTASSVVIAGINGISRNLAANMSQHPEYGLAFRGYFDDRKASRLGDTQNDTILGKLGDLPNYVRQEQIDTIFIAIPISHVQRTQDLLDDLKDTTASIYFVPDIFVVDLIQSRPDQVSGIHVLALCETPFHGWRAFLKRLSDIVLATTILLLAAPLMLFVAAAIKATTSDSVIFKQRRYGLGGEEIIVYKFRTMTVSDDGGDVKQASAADPRVTRLGRFLRRTSIDELPQLINVLQGSMSVVGPRPHAVAHNEQYRKLIKGYMVRHKVSPGITGLAQVSGCRGETATVEDMERRIHYDLQYLREWSLSLDLKILSRTVLSLISDKQAY